MKNSVLSTADKDNLTMMNKLPIKLPGLYLDIKLIRARKVIGWYAYKAYNLLSN